MDVNEIEIISVKMLGDVVISYNTLGNGTLSENKVIENITLKNRKYFININGKKIFFNWDSEAKKLIEPTPKQFKQKISET